MTEAIGLHPSRLFEQPANLVILSIQADVEQEAWCHRQENYKICPPADWQQQWSPAARQWLTSHFVKEGLLSVAQFQEHFSQLIDRLKKDVGAQIIVFNGSSYDPEDKSHNYSGRELPPFIRRHQFNLALAQLSAKHDFYIVDVDRISAAMGAGRHVLAPFVYSHELHQALGQEVECIAHQMGLFAQTSWLKLLLPPTELQIENGHVLRWHKAEGQPVKMGEPLLDYRADKIVRAMRVRDKQAQIVAVQQVSKADWTVEIQITAGQDGYLQRVLAPAGQPHPPANPFALLTLEADPAGLPDQADIPPFPATLHLLP